MLKREKCISFTPCPQSDGVGILLIWHSKYSPYCQKYAPTDCFFGDFAHWEEPARYRLARKYTWKYTPIVSFFSPSAFDTKTLDSRIEESNVGHKLLMKMGKH